MASNPRMVVVGLDGATFHLIKPWVEAGKLPTFARLLAEGAHADLRSTLPALTPPAWTSAATGKNPGKHNIYNFYKVSDGGTGKLPLTPADLRSRRVWDIANAYGKRAGVVHLPLTYPPEHLDGFVVSGIMTPKGVEDYTYPPELRDELAAHIDGYRFDVDGDALKVGDLTAFAADAFDLQRIQTAETLYVLDHKPWDLLWVMFHTLDKVQHFFWHLMDPKHPAYPGPNEFEDVILRFHQRLDETLAAILQRLDDATSLLVMSDHGSCRLESYFLIMNWLEDTGFLRMKGARRSPLKRALGGMGLEARGVVETLRRAGLGWVPRLVPSRLKQQVPQARASFARIAPHIDWSETRVFCPSAPGSGLRINLRGRESQGTVAPEDYDRVCEEVRARLLTIVDPTTGRRVVRAVHRRHEIYAGPHVENGPDLLVETTDPYCLIEGMGPSAIVPSGYTDGERTGNHLRDGIFLLAGAAARRGAALPTLDICDVAPTLLYLLDIPVQEDMDGAVAQGAVTPELLAKRPVQTDQLAPLPEVAATEMSDRDRRAIEGMLEGLGYL
jgi:predicted AlkP superfamily phosphohydrolase/phosphomutase